MSLKKIAKELIYNIIISSIDDSPLFTDYVLYNTDINSIEYPEVIIQFDFYLKSITFNRSVQIRISDYFKNQKLEIWIDKLDDTNLNRFNVKYHFIKLNINKIKQKLIFKCNSENELYEKVSKTLNFISDNADDKLVKILKGEDWFDMPFDWGEYK